MSGDVPNTVKENSVMEGVNAEGRDHGVVEQKKNSDGEKEIASIGDKSIVKEANDSVRASSTRTYYHSRWCKIIPAVRYSSGE